MCQLIVVTDTGTAVFHPLQNALAECQRLAHLLCINPADPFSFHLKACFPHGLQVSCIAPSALSVIRLENAADPRMSLCDQIFGRRSPDLLVVHADMRNVKLRIVAVKEQDRNPGLLKTSVTGKVGIWKRTHDWLHDQRITASRLKQSFQQASLRLDLIVRKHDPRTVTASAKRAYHRLQDARKNIIVRIRRDDRNRAGKRWILSAALLLLYIRAAALYADDRALFLKDRKCMAHGLAADLEQLADFIFRLKTVTARKLPGRYSVVNPLCHFLVFCRSAHCHSILYVRIRPDSGFTWLSVIDPVIL